MGTIASLDDLVTKMTGGNNGNPQNIWWTKVARVGGAAPTAPVAGRMVSLWRFDGQPSGGAAPTTVANPDNTTPGGLRQANASGGRTLYNIGGQASALAGGTLILYDRLLHIGNLSGTVTTAQTVGGSLTRNTGGAGNFIMAEIYTSVGATATTISASYTNQAGTSGRTSPTTTFGGTGFNTDTRAIMLPLANGDTGVQAVASVTVTATTGTAGNFGIVVGQYITSIPVPHVAGPAIKSLVDGLPGVPAISSGACLAWLFIPFNTTVPEMIGSASFVEA